MKSIWRRIAESTEGPTVTFTLPRDTARDLLVALGDSLEVDIDLDALEGGDDGMGDEPDADDMGGPPDGDMDDMGLDLDDGGGGGTMDVLGDMGLGGDEDDMPAGDADMDGDDDDAGPPKKRGPGRPPGSGKKKAKKPEPDDGDDDDGDEKDESAGSSAWSLAERHIGFKKMTQKFADKGFDNPAGAAYKVGVEKYGKEGMAAKAAAGRRKG